jgi:hypothetical protein
MVSRHEALESLIVQLERARTRTKRGGSKQVRKADEIDYLKSLSYAWFNSSRQQLGELATNGSVDAVDEAFRTVLDATAGFAARSTYINALSQAKKALVIARTAALGPAQSKVPEIAPDFSALASDTEMRKILGRRWGECQACLKADAHLAATVMMGGLLETLLLSRINLALSKTQIFTSLSAPRDKAGRTLPLSGWKLIDMVEVAHELEWITKSAKDVGNVLRDFRNYIHPHKEHTDGILITAEDAEMFWEVCKAISRQVLRSAARS